MKYAKFWNEGHAMSSVASVQGQSTVAQVQGQPITAEIAGMPVAVATAVAVPFSTAVPAHAVLPGYPLQPELPRQPQSFDQRPGRFGRWQSGLFERVCESPLCGKAAFCYCSFVPQVSASKHSLRRGTSV